MADSQKHEINLNHPLMLALEEFQAINSDRATGVLGGVLLDDALAEALLHNWRGDESEQTKTATASFLREGGGALTLGLKIDLAYLTSLIGPDTHADLMTIRNIRNKFAHHTVMANNHKPIAPPKFETQQIAAWCDNLRIYQKVGICGVYEPTLEPKLKFILSVIIYAGLIGGIADGTTGADMEYLKQ